MGEPPTPLHCDCPFHMALRCRPPHSEVAFARTLHAVAHPEAGRGSQQLHSLPSNSNSLSAFQRLRRPLIPCFVYGDPGVMISGRRQCWLDLSHYMHA